MALNLRTWAEVFRGAREAKGWTQLQAAFNLGVSLRTINNWELGEKEPRLEHVIRCAEAFGWALPFMGTESYWNRISPSDLRVPDAPLESRALAS